ncbi:hypothetical protein DCAR_0831310 [Daucus carota subsp. sativus]|uniref:Leucine-rich repeat-containing N-terminal plant-type domain-containing protein n=2 Tax=Daucus carota subsp. sativus TaxID=79200 RepID=A0AAF0XRB2_DAUCS|nr:hypothetical protein DCAR_0831310 [Daucus carota subsp. sativus]
MRNFITCFLAIVMMLLFLQNHPVASLSPNMQKIALFKFRQSLTISTPRYCYYESYNDYYSSPSHPKTMNWSMSSDHCTWEGVSCEHKTGEVIGLDLSCSQLEGAILPNSTLFQLAHLQFLNLFGNNFTLTNQFPQEFGFFAKGLTHLNLSYTSISGRVPSGISHLYKLVSLDLSHYYAGMQLKDEVFKLLLQNLTLLRVLNLQEVNISTILPFNISTSLRVLNLRNTDLHGVVPQEVFNLPKLEVLDLSSNNDLTTTLPKAKWGSSATLQHLYLRDMNIYGGIPDSVGFLELLATLDIAVCNLSGLIPRSVKYLGQLTHLDLSFNNLNGPIPTDLANLTNLRLLTLSDNNFSGPFPSLVAHTRKLTELDLSINGFTGSLPHWLFDHPSLETLYIRYNGFTGKLHEFNSSKSHLEEFDCSGNQLNGTIPQSFLQLVNLFWLSFASNNFSGVLDFKKFSRFENLQILDLSHNNLSVRNMGMSTLPPDLHHLGLSSCNLKEFPHLSGETRFFSFSHIDLSNNQIDREIPHWIGLQSWQENSYLNLSHNRLTGGLDQLPQNNIQYLDLQFNLLNGSLPSLICDFSYLDVLNLSHNNLSGVLPICTTNLTNLSVFDVRMNNIQGTIPAALSNFRHLETLNLNGNKLAGRIPSSFAEFEYLKVLDLGNNQINDTFPQFLEALPHLQVLVLRLNKFHGVINKSSKNEHPFPSLKIIDLSHNEFSGPLPATYFKNFNAMMNGGVNETKPTYMGNFFYSDSTNLVIKGVEREFVRILIVFTTIDLSRNNFKEEIPGYIGNLVSLRYLNLSYNQLTGHIPSSLGKLTVLESLDLSYNQLEGEIPRQLTSLYSLARLNLSGNQLSGHIPEGSQFNTFENDSYVGNLGLCGHPLSKMCENDIGTQEDQDDDYFFNGFTWEAVVTGYGCGVVPAFVIGYLMLHAGKPKWFAGIIARELGLKIRRMEIKWR